MPKGRLNLACVGFRFCYNERFCVFISNKKCSHTIVTKPSSNRYRVLQFIRRNGHFSYLLSILVFRIILAFSASEQ
jgi:hypothetical protein